MNSNNPFIIYKSSAGSGKTYTLTMEYLKLALEFPTAFRHILAVTFTNKATQEMKERILRELGRLKAGVNPEEKMDSVLLKHLNVTQDELRSRAKSALSAILHDYSAFSVSTIDSFFQRIIRAFAREIDLQAKFDVELDQDGVLDRLVDRLIVQVASDEFLHRWLLAYAVEQIQEGKSWDIRKNIKNLGKQLFQEAFKRYSPEIKVFLKDKENIQDLQTYLFHQRKLIIAQAQDMKIVANEIRERHGLAWEDFKGGSVSFARKFDQLGEPFTPVPDLSPTQRNLSDDPEAWYTKTSRLKDQIEMAVREGLAEIWGQFLPLKKQWNTLEAIRKNFFVFGVFRNLLEELDNLKEEENILLISDSNDFLKEITADIDAPFIYEKVGNKFQNYLIDEFQDTSGFQWASFRPLLVNTLSQGHTNLLVGDVKQSIYRWRGGEMRLLLDQVESELGHYGLDIQNLDTNYRSLPAIVDFNNVLFHTLPDQLAGVLESSHGIEDGGLLHKAYADVTQHVAPAKEAASFRGKVRMEFLAVDTDEDDDLTTQEMQVARIPEMVIELQEKGFRPKDIAFLVRTKKEGLQVADALVAYGLKYPDSAYSFEVLSDEALLVSKSTSVKCLIAGFRFLADTSDDVNLWTMWYHWSVLFGFPVDHELFHHSTIPVFLNDRFTKFKALESKLLQLPLLELVDVMTEFLGFTELGIERAYVSAFKEGIYDFVAKNRADLVGFLDWWENHQDKLTVKIPEGHDAMRILTIHKSKGLQFKVVLMPFLNWKIVDNAKGNIVWTPFELKNESLNAVIPLTITKALEDSFFQSTYQEEVLMNFLDTLNMVYVAATRAEEVFWSISPYQKPTSRATFATLAANLQQVVRSSSTMLDGMPLNSHFDENLLIFDFGEWPCDKVALIPVPSPYPLRWEYRSWSDLLQVKAYPGDLNDLGIIQRNQGDFGTMIHHLLEKAKTEGEMLLGLDELFFEGVLDRTEKDHIQSKIKEFFSIPKFKSWFEGEGDILTEQGILLPGGNHKRPDRIIIYPNEVEVVDFKTGLPREGYLVQIREYMFLVKKLTNLPVKGYLCYLDSVRIEEIDP
ncbi:MAG TPA: UvrD-helicase domain-containing protein [Lunatimonas sp.]|nr:UvrD-helicase domain-containing protein [Lunatimonas sp.]